MKKFSDESCRENKHTHTHTHRVYVKQLFFHNPTVCDVEKFCRTGQAAEHNMVHARCMLGT